MTIMKTRAADMPRTMAARLVPFSAIVRHTALVVAAAAALGGCATKGVATTVYDFGPLPAAPVSTMAAGSGVNGQPAWPALTSAPAAGTTAAGQAATRAPALVIADVNGPASLDSNRMYYRLLYADAQQSRPYAQNAWSVTPLQLLSQRLRARIAQAGVKVLATTDAAVGVPLLRLEADDFSQNFDSVTRSSGQVSLRASLFRNHKLVDQKTFTRSTEAHSADAAGGARALAASSDAIAADILAWLATLPQ